MAQQVSRVADGLYSPLWDAQEGKCFYCTRPMRKMVPNSRSHNIHKLVTRDHFVPAVYGTKLWGNVVLACVKCNTKAMHSLPTPEEVERFQKLYDTLGYDTSYALMMLAEATKLLANCPEKLAISSVVVNLSSKEALHGEEGR